MLLRESHDSFRHVFMIHNTKVRKGEGEGERLRWSCFAFGYVSGLHLGEIKEIHGLLTARHRI